VTYKKGETYLTIFCFTFLNYDLHNLLLFFTKYCWIRNQGGRNGTECSTHGKYERQMNTVIGKHERKKPLQGPGLTSESKDKAVLKE
jgi:hypothetical protein